MTIPFQKPFSSFELIAGPCAIESEELFFQIAREVKKHGATGLRGGIYKMRTQAKSFQGLQQEGLAIAHRVKSQVGLPLIVEVTDVRQIEALEPFVDVFQVGARNMYQYELLKELGKTRTPVLLKRGFMAYFEEWLGATEYILQGGNEHIILCERGIRTFETCPRNTLDLAAIPLLKKRCPFPVWIDPSHAAGRRDLVIPLALAATAAGADGLLIEVHPKPEEALSDGPQALTFEDLAQLIPQIRAIRQALQASPPPKTPSLPTDPILAPANALRT